MGLNLDCGIHKKEIIVGLAGFSGTISSQVTQLRMSKVVKVSAEEYIRLLTLRMCKQSCHMVEMCYIENHPQHCPNNYLVVHSS